MGLRTRVEIVVLLVVAVGFVMRLATAIPGYLNPDELLHVLIAGKTSVANTLRMMAVIQTPHPPLYFLVVYLLNLVGASEVVLRLPSVLAGTALVWVGFKWMRMVLGDVAALAGAMVLAFAPELVLISAEVREYAIMILLLFSALLFLEQGLRDQSARKMLLFALMLLLAVSVLYASIAVALALGVYVLVRMISTRPPGRVVFAWVTGQVAVVGLAVFYYLVHISKLMGAKRSGAADGWLASSYFHTGQDSVLLFPLRQTVEVFQYLFSSRVAGIVALAAFAVGLIVLLVVAGNSVGVRRRRDAALLLALPLVVNCGAALLRVYPYGGTRHCLYLVAFVAAGLGFALAKAVRGHVWPLLAASLVLVPVWSVKFQPSQHYIAPRDQRRQLMTDMIDYIREVTPESGVVFTDHQTEVVLRHYLCGVASFTGDVRRGDFMDLSCEDVRLVYPHPRFVSWSFDAGRFGEFFSRMVAELRLERGQEVCVVSAGWGWNLAPALESHYNLHYSKRRMFGNHLSVFVVPVGSEPGNQQAHHALLALAKRATTEAGGWVRTVLWPTDQLNDSVRQIADQLGEQMFSYKDLYPGLEGDVQRLAEYLPAFAFWQFGNCEEHPEFMRYMDAAQNYTSAGLRFTLLAVDSVRTAGAYLVETMPSSR